MSDPPPLEIGSPSFLAAFHLPGLRLPEPVFEVVQSVVFREISYSDWLMIEDSDLAYELFHGFTVGRPAFCVISLNAFEGTVNEALELREALLHRLRTILTALRLHKAGPLVDPAQSSLYLRLGTTNIREPGLYRHRLFEASEDTYPLTAGERHDIAAVFRALETYRDGPEASVELALRHFDWSYRYGLSPKHRAALLYIALEATFGEYSIAKRPNPKATLGEVAAVVSRAGDPSAVAEFLDDPERGRGVRNHLAHGDAATPPAPLSEVIPTVEDAVRDGLRSLVGFVPRMASLSPDLEAVATGLSQRPPKDVFQVLLGHAAQGSNQATALLRAA